MKPDALSTPNNDRYPRYEPSHWRLSVSWLTDKDRLTDAMMLHLLFRVPLLLQNLLVFDFA